MNSTTFHEEILNRRLKLTTEVLGIKAAEYSHRGDRLSNFKDGAAMQNISPEEYCFALTTKHIVSVKDMIQTGACYSQEKWDEKIGDIINYMILLEGVLRDSGKVAMAAQAVDTARADS